MQAATSDKPGAEAGEGTGLIGQGDLSTFNKQPVTLDPIPADLAFLGDMEKYLATQTGLEDLDALKTELAKKTSGCAGSALTSTPLPPRYSLAYFVWLTTV